MFHPRHWPWWGWVLVVVGALIAVLLVTLALIRQAGRRDLAQELARCAAEHRGVFMRDLVALAPPLDATRQAEAWALVGAGATLSWDKNQQTGGMLARLTKPREVAQRDRETRELLALSANARQRWHALVTSGPVCVSVLGWIRENLPDPDKSGVAELEHIRHPSLTALRFLATALAAEARTARDPLPALHDLDALCSAMRPNASVIDAMVGIVGNRIRDEAWLEAICRGVAPDTFIRQDVDQLACLREGWDGERMLFAGAQIQDCLAGRHSSWGASPAPGLLERCSMALDSAASAVIAPHDLALTLRIQAVGEQILTTGNGSFVPLANELAAHPWPPRINSRGMLVTNEAIPTAAQADVEAREIRLAGLLVAMQADSHPLPVQLDEPRALALIAASPLRPALIYRRLDEHRFRIDIDPMTAPPALIPAGQIVQPPAAASSQAWRRTKYWLELDVTALDAP